DTATGSERGDTDESGRSPTPSRQVRKRVCFDHIDCRPTIYHPGGIFEELVDWESRLPCVPGPRKSRLPLFTRKQQRLLDKAREMGGVPDLSALLKGKLQPLTKKSTTVDSQGPSNSGVDVTSEGGGTSREGPPKKEPSERKALLQLIRGAGQRLLLQVPRRRKRPKGLKWERPTRFLSKSLLPSMRLLRAKKKKDGRKRSRGGAEGQETVLVGAASDGHPRKRTKRSVEAEPRSVAKRKRIEFPDRVEFSYNKITPLILNPLRCAELTCQIRGGTKEMPQLEDLYFKNKYIDAASSRARFEELEGKLKSAGAAKKKLVRENT
ncbi:LOW QUALITY PROTEIN: hypothetical protein HID58_070813, partial [Brassica napus]